MHISLKIRFSISSNTSKESLQYMDVCTAAIQHSGFFRPEYQTYERIQSHPSIYLSIYIYIHTYLIFCACNQFVRNVSGYGHHSPLICTEKQIRLAAYFFQCPAWTQLRPCLGRWGFCESKLGTPNLGWSENGETPIIQWLPL